MNRNYLMILIFAIFLLCGCSNDLKCTLTERDDTYKFSKEYVVKYNGDIVSNVEEINRIEFLNEKEFNEYKKIIDVLCIKDYYDCSYEYDGKEIKYTLKSDNISTFIKEFSNDIKEEDLKEKFKDIHYTCN